VQQSTLPFCRGVSTVYWELEFDRFTILLSKLVGILHVKHDQFRKGGKFLPSIKIVKISGILDFYVRHLTIPPAKVSTMKFD